MKPLLRSRFAPTLLLVMGLLSGQANCWAQPPRQKLIVAMHEPVTQRLADASKAFDGASFDLEWAILPGSAAQITALYAKAIDVAYIGDTAIDFEAANSSRDWNTEGAQLVNFASWQWDYLLPGLVTAVRTDRNIQDAKDLKGKTWAFNFGGTPYALYVASLVKAGLTPKDIKPAQMTDAYVASSAFVRGDVDVLSDDYYSIRDLVEAGKAKVMWTSQEVGVPNLAVLVARPQTLVDKHDAIADLLVRFGRYHKWYLDNPQAAQAIIASTLKLSPERAAYYWASNRWQYVSINDESLAAQQKVADLFYSAGALKKKINVRALWTNQFSASTVVQP
ncbi:ABC transporter substrate-binding protein [Pseudomonas typographi]|uniref:ABC transporter substrate-binding protein n=1 Tax=Pseudomonas typographi TaxID=2715964 RepID=A0ABR7Z2R3_9PSED|nr:ABC transporter substrate-binding protein [Pseudomonas typographi]MBD1553121.1 ABC transporter substrate-binding protein [Pseudomonas typographi]MBD1585892.1 ABC transporter substrate-binding protein [Pseudomonas typographi]MBD1599742.1 ABC transporter substrate-binding protein [Pseudomonas typographi]